MISGDDFPVYLAAIKKPTFNPRNFLGLRLWLDGSDTSTITQSNNLVSQWTSKDLSGPNNATASGTEKPTFNVSGLNSKGTLGFDGLTQALDVANEVQFDFGLGQSITMCALFDPSSTGGSQAFGELIVKGVVGPAYKGYRVAYIGSPDFYIQFDIISDFSTGSYMSVISNGPTTPGDDQWNRIIVTYDGNINSSGMKIYINGVLQNKIILHDAIAGDFLNNSNLTVAKNSDATFPNFYKGQIAELEFYNLNFTQAQVTTFDNYIKAKWGL